MNAGLAVFVAVVVLDVCGLSLDGLLWLLDLATVTSLVRAGNKLPGFIIVGLQLLGANGLAYHFWGVR